MKVELELSPMQMEELRIAIETRRAQLGEYEIGYTQYGDWQRKRHARECSAELRDVRQQLVKAGLS